jgi:hypothetical protein
VEATHPVCEHGIPCALAVHELQQEVVAASVVQAAGQLHKRKNEVENHHAAHAVHLRQATTASADSIGGCGPGRPTGTAAAQGMRREATGYQMLAMQHEQKHV